MAKLERTFHGENFDRLLCRIEEGVMQGSMSATLEDSADYHAGDARCSVRVFERYSYSGSNRVSMSVTLFQAGDTIRLCAVTSGGSQAMFFKINTWGEESFLNTLATILR